MQVECYIISKKELDITGITLLSIEECEKHKQHITPIDCVWWLRSPGYSSECAACVHRDGNVLRHRGYVHHIGIAVRPALQIKNPNYAKLNAGDRFGLFGYDWTVISRELALCDEAIEKHAFREDWRAKDANDYEKSDVKRFVEEWLQEKMQA